MNNRNLAKRLNTSFGLVAIALTSIAFSNGCVEVNVSLGSGNTSQSWNSTTTTASSPSSTTTTTVAATPTTTPTAVASTPPPTPIPITITTAPGESPVLQPTQLPGVFILRVSTEQAPGQLADVAR